MRSGLEREDWQKATAQRLIQQGLLQKAYRQGCAEGLQ